MPKVSQQHRDARRAQILAAARACFLRAGFQGTSMHDLFAESGLSAGSFYTYFAGKDDVIAAVAADNVREVAEMVHALASDESLGRTLADVLDVVLARQTDSELGAVAVMVWAEALRNPALLARINDTLDPMRADLTAAVRRHQRSGALTDDVPAEAFVALLLSTVPGVIVQMTMSGAESVRGVPQAAAQLWP